MPVGDTPSYDNEPVVRTTALATTRQKAADALHALLDALATGDPTRATPSAELVTVLYAIAYQQNPGA